MIVSASRTSPGSLSFRERTSICIAKELSDSLLKLSFQSCRFSETVRHAVSPSRLLVTTYTVVPPLKDAIVQRPRVVLWADFSQIYSPPVSNPPQCISSFPTPCSSAMLLFAESEIRNLSAGCLSFNPFPCTACTKGDGPIFSS